MRLARITTLVFAALHVSLSVTAVPIPTIPEALDDQSPSTDIVTNDNDNVNEMTPSRLEQGLDPGPGPDGQEEMTIQSEESDSKYGTVNPPPITTLNGPIQVVRPPPTTPAALAQGKSRLQRFCDYARTPLGGCIICGTVLGCGVITTAITLGNLP